MRYISDTEYYINLVDDDLDKIINDYSILKDGSGNFLDGSVIELFQVDSTFVRNGNQMFFNPSGGTFEQGYLQYTNIINDNNDKKFVLEWYDGLEGNGYYFWPNNNDSNRALTLFANTPKKDTDDSRISAYYNNQGKDWPKELEQYKRLFRFEYMTTSPTKKLIVGLNIRSPNPEIGTYNIAVNSINEIISVKSPTPKALWEVKFITLGKNAWKYLMQKDPTFSIKYKGCFKDIFNLDRYENYLTAYNEMNVDCGVGIPNICENVLGFDSQVCKTYCNTTGNETKCFENLKNWCQKSGNNSKPECSCFDTDGFKKFNCSSGKCKYDELPQCYYPNCIKSGYSRVYSSNKQSCPQNTISYQECITNIENSNITANEASIICKLDGIDSVDKPPADKPPADKPPADKPPADKPPADKPPADTPPVDKPEPSFWEKYKWIIIGIASGGIGLLLFIGIIYAYSSNKNSLTYE